MELIALYYYIGQLIRYYRKLKGLSQEEMAAAIDVARTTIVHWEEGKNRISIEQLYRLAEYFGITVNEFLPNPSKRLMQTKNQAFLDFLKGEDHA